MTKRVELCTLYVGGYMVEIFCANGRALADLNICVRAFDSLWSKCLEFEIYAYIISKKVLCCLNFKVSLYIQEKKTK